MPATGWTAGDPVFVGNGVVGFGPQLVDNVYTGGCHWQGTAQTPPVGPTVDDLAAALSAQNGPGASPPTDVTVGGRPGKKVELQIPAAIDVSTCDSDGDFAIFGRWYSGPDGTSGAQPYTHTNGQHDTVYIVDVDGTRQVIDAWYPTSASAADRAALDQIVASIRFEPRPTGPTPSPTP